VLNNINLSINKGDFLALVGPNGCGKTTLIKLICDLLEKQEGHIKFRGIDNDRLQVKKSFLYLPSDDVLPDFLTGAEYIDLMLKMYEKTLNQTALEKMSEFYSFESALDVLIEEYSHGMKKKIQLMTALLIEPEILIIDETLNGIDIESLEITKILLKKYMKQNKTIIMCSHDLHLLEEVCNRVVVLYNGVVHIDKDMDEIKKNSNLITTFRQIIKHDELINKIMMS